MENGANVNPNQLNETKWDYDNPIVLAFSCSNPSVAIDILNLFIDPQKKFKFKHRFDWVCT